MIRGFLRPGFLPDADGAGLIPIAGDLLRGDQTVPGIVYPETPAALAAMMGGVTAPTSMWRFTQLTGAAPDLAASASLTATNSPTQGGYDSRLRSVCVETADASTSSMAAAANTVLDVTAGSVACLWVGRVTANPTAQGGLVGKRTTTGTNGVGYSLIVRSAGSLRGGLGDGTHTDTETTTGTGYGDGVPFIAMLVVDRTANTVRVITDREATAGQAIDATTLTNTSVFAIGNQAFVAVAGPTKCALAAVWSGTGAEGLGASHVAALKAAMRL